MTKRLKASEQLSLKDLLARITSSHIERREGFITLFMCSVSPSCKIPELLQYSMASRIEINVATGNVKIWFHDYTPKPDVLIKGALLCEKDLSLS